MTATPGLLRFLDPEVGVRSIQVPSGIAGGGVTTGGNPTSASIAFVVLNAASDPGVNQDVSQGYSVGSVVFNSTVGFLRTWTCRDNTLGAAKWVYEGADFANGGTNPNSEVTQFGLGAALMAEEGNIFRQISSPGITTGANGSDIVLATFTLPANSFDVTGRGVAITAQGSFGGNGNNKRIKIIFNVSGNIAVGGSVGAGNGSTIADTAVVTTNGSGWAVQGLAFKYGATGSNTQLGLHQQAQVGGSVAALLAPTAITATENAAIQVVITGNTTTLTNDIVLNFCEINALN